MQRASRRLQSLVWGMCSRSCNCMSSRCTEFRAIFGRISTKSWSHGGPSPHTLQNYRQVADTLINHSVSVHTRRSSPAESTPGTPARCCAHAWRAWADHCGLCQAYLPNFRPLFGIRVTVFGQFSASFRNKSHSFWAIFGQFSVHWATGPSHLPIPTHSDLCA